MCDVRSSRTPFLTRSSPSSRRPMCVIISPFMHVVSVVARERPMPRRCGAGVDCTSMLGEFFQDLVRGFEALLQLPRLVKRQQFLEEPGFLRWEDSFLRDVGHDAGSDFAVGGCGLRKHADPRGGHAEACRTTKVEKLHEGRRYPNLMSSASLRVTMRLLTISFRHPN
ncbi:unnamed protein product [Mycena citricolor]|uniref:Uncharacterized protein n=1 Tax=Mycena citricolor TaxID=2018698 RepID=A0AAD2H8Z2_9AGAR|nr:unnamed protein product [Mycena citricolor]